MANHVEHIAGRVGLLLGAGGLIKGRFIQQELKQ